MFGGSGGSGSSEASSSHSSGWPLTHTVLTPPTPDIPILPLPHMVGTQSPEVNRWPGTLVTCLSITELMTQGHRGAWSSATWLCPDEWESTQIPVSHATGRQPSSPSASSDSIIAGDCSERKSVACLSSDRSVCVFTSVQPPEYTMSRMDYLPCTYKQLIYWTKLCFWKSATCTNYFTERHCVYEIFV